MQTRAVNWTSYVDTTAPAEQDRLTLLQEVFDPFSERLLDRIGIRPGWDCLEVGAGAGSVARMLAERAGSAHVTATDMTTDFLGPVADLGVRVLRHDVIADDAPGEFDLIHSRMLLEHLTEREEVVRRLGSWLKPGGLLVAECASPVPELAGDPAVGRALAALGRLMSRSVGTDPLWARSLPRPFVEGGLVDCQAEGYSVAVRGGTPSGHWLAATHRLVEEQALASGALSRADLDAAYTAYANPSYVDYSWLIVSSTGRRPA